MCASFHDFAAYEQLVDAASSLEANAYLVVLLGGEAGLRCGEMLALRWNDVNLATGQLTVGTVRVERTHHGYERWACAVRATAGSALGSVTDASASSWFPCPRWERRTTIDAEDGPESREVDSSSSGGTTRGPHSAPHVLFAFSHAWRVSAVDSGTGGSPELGDHAAVYAPDSSHVRGDGQAAESTNRCPRCWRHIGDGAIADD